MPLDPSPVLSPAALCLAVAQLFASWTRLYKERPDAKFSWLVSLVLPLLFILVAISLMVFSFEQSIPNELGLQVSLFIYGRLLVVYQVCCPVHSEMR
jgi:hypothetical protein